jgi:hypothetical protein
MVRKEKSDKEKKGQLKEQSGNYYKKMDYGDSR